MLFTRKYNQVSVGLQVSVGDCKVNCFQAVSTILALLGGRKRHHWLLLVTGMETAIHNPVTPGSMCCQHSQPLHSRLTREGLGPTISTTGDGGFAQPFLLPPLCGADRCCLHCHQTDFCTVPHLAFFKAMKKAVSAKDKVWHRDLKPKHLDEVPGSSPSSLPSLQLAQEYKPQEKCLTFSW